MATKLNLKSRALVALLVNGSLYRDGIDYNNYTTECKTENMEELCKYKNKNAVDLQDKLIKHTQIKSFKTHNRTTTQFNIAGNA